jgi:hypothetical protein
MRLTIKDGRGTVTSGDTPVHDPDSDAEVIAAAKRVCRANSKSFPSSGARILVEESAGRGRWRFVRELVA